MPRTSSINESQNNKEVFLKHEQALTAPKLEGVWFLQLLNIFSMKPLFLANRAYSAVAENNTIQTPLPSRGTLVQQAYDYSNVYVCVFVFRYMLFSEILTVLKTFLNLYYIIKIFFNWKNNMSTCIFEII